MSVRVTGALGLLLVLTTACADPVDSGDFGSRPKPAASAPPSLAEAQTACSRAGHDGFVNVMSADGFRQAYAYLGASPPEGLSRLAPDLPVVECGSGDELGSPSVLILVDGTRLGPGPNSGPLGTS